MRGDPAATGNQPSPRCWPGKSRDYDVRVNKSGLDMTGLDRNFDRSGLHP